MSNGGTIHLVKNIDESNENVSLFCSKIEAISNGEILSTNQKKKINQSSICIRCRRAHRFAADLR